MEGFWGAAVTGLVGFLATSAVLVGATLGLYTPLFGLDQGHRSLYLILSQSLA